MAYRIFEIATDLSDVALIFVNVHIYGLTVTEIYAAV